MIGEQRRLGEILVEKGIVTPEQVDKAIELQASNDRMRIGDALVELGAADWDEITNALGELLGYEVVDLPSMSLPLEAIEAVPKAIAKQHPIVPISRHDGTLTMAITDPFDLYAMDNLRFVLNADVRCVLASPEAVDEAIQKYYGIEESTVDNMLAEFTDSDIGYEDEELDEEGEEGDDAPLIRLVQLMITEAVKTRTSDIHIEPLQNRLRIRYRIDGVCEEMDAPPKRLQGAVIARVKIMSGMDIAEKRRPQDGRIAITAAGSSLDIRVSALPATHGESVVMRLLHKESILVNLQELGFHDTDYQRFQAIIKRPNGIFLVTGPTGSGKTTTLYAALNELNRPDKKIITAEDPVEYNLTGVNQCQVNERIGLNFPAILRSMLRQAPNIILVGEIRDRDTAEVAIQAALTGHLVFSTLHTNDAASAITRLIDIGIKPFLVASSVQAIMAQRLVRLLCDQCRQPYDADPRMLRAVGLRPEEMENVTFYRSVGCPTCRNVGYKGRSGIFELMEMNNVLREMTFRRETYQDLRKQARLSGMLTLLEDGVRKILAGKTTVEEVIERAGREEEEEIM